MFWYLENSIGFHVHKDMDIASILKDLQGQKPPLECPVCGKQYRSFSGISYHVVKFHANGQVGSSSSFNSAFSDSFNTPENLKKQPLSYADAQRMVEFDIKGSMVRNLITEPMTIEVENEGSEEEETVPEVKITPTKSPARGTPRRRGRGRGHRFVHYKQRYLDVVKRSLNAADEKKPPPLPVAVYNIIPEEENLTQEIPKRKSYFRFIEKSSDELDDEVEYGMDEEDYIWLEELNGERKTNNLMPVGHEVFEMLMDRLEKESHFETRTVSGDPYNLIDEDAVCSICCDGECSNSNVILFCDMCNLAVHQECYGVPYIPEGQWLCRKCLQSPSKPVSCLLCPTKSGAFKQTDTNNWTHVVCALWIPEVCFANTVFLEPIDSIGNIPPARWKLVCYICKKKTGACIQCFKTNCYTAFHVTCAQQGGLYMKIEAGRLENGQPTIKKSAYCDVHMPKDAAPGFGTPCHSDYCSDEDSDTSVQSKASAISKASGNGLIKKPTNYQTPSAKLKEVQKKLLEKQSFKMPAVHIPFVPAHRLAKIVSKVALAKKSQFIQQLQSYWMLKRQSRNGVPLLRRLQMNTGTGINRNQREQTLEEWSQSKELKEQLRYWQQLRHDLERVRLLIELVRKREKMKKEQYRMKQQLIDLQLKPQQLEMERTLMLLQERDTTGIFADPVKPEEAPDYHDFILRPMDFSTMRQKLADYEYLNFEMFEDDFNLMIQNCLSFNHEDTIYYRAALRMRTQCKMILKGAHKRIKQACIDPQTGIHVEIPQSSTTDETSGGDDVSSLIENPFMTIDEKIEDLEMKLEISNTIKSALARLARQKKLRKEISKLKRQKRRLDNPFNAASNTENENLNKVNCGPRGHTNLTSSFRHKKKGRKRRNATPNNYSGEVKVPGDINSNGNGTTIPIASISTSTTLATKGAEGQSPSTLVFTEPSKIVVRNPSPGRSRRSGILFKKKQYQPVTPSPLVLFSSSTSEGGVTTDGSGSHSPLKLRLRIDKNGFKKDATPNTEQNSTCDQNSRKLLTRSKSAEISSERENVIYGAGHSPTRVSKRRLSSQTYTSRDSVRRRDVTASLPSIDGLSSKINGEQLNDADDDCFLDESQMTECLDGRRPRKRTYTSSSANSDSETTSTYGRRKSHKRGRQKSAKLSFRQEFADLEGLNNIKYGIYMINPEEAGLLDPKNEPSELEMLTLVWAKCKGYPSYPALTIDPKMPRSGFQSNGVPIPIPPNEVLGMNEHIDRYLILFFDARRTWQWLPRDKIEPLGVDSRLDEVRLIESKKPSMRKNVHEAYKRAISFRRRLEIGENSDEDENGRSPLQEMVPDDDFVMNGCARPHNEDDNVDEYDIPSPIETLHAKQLKPQISQEHSIVKENVIVNGDGEHLGNDF